MAVPHPNPHLEYYGIFKTQIKYARQDILAATAANKQFITVASLFSEGKVPYEGATAFRRYLALYLADHHPDLMITEAPHHIVYRVPPTPQPKLAAKRRKTTCKPKGLPRLRALDALPVIRDQVASFMNTTADLALVNTLADSVHCARAAYAKVLKQYIKDENLPLIVQRAPNPFSKTKYVSALCLLKTEDPRP
jgi:hypothetical protein